MGIHGKGEAFIKIKITNLISNLDRNQALLSCTVQMKPYSSTLGVSYSNRLLQPRNLGRYVIRYCIYTDIWQAASFKVRSVGSLARRRCSETCQHFIRKMLRERVITSLVVDTVDTGLDTGFETGLEGRGLGLRLGDLEIGRRRRRCNNLRVRALLLLSTSSISMSSSDSANSS